MVECSLSVYSVTQLRNTPGAEPGVEHTLDVTSAWMYNTPVGPTPAGVNFHSNLKLYVFGSFYPTGGA